MYFVADAAREADVLKPGANVVMPPVSVSQTSPGTVFRTVVRPLDWLPVDVLVVVQAPDAGLVRASSG